MLRIFGTIKYAVVQSGPDRAKLQTHRMRLTGKLLHEINGTLNVSDDHFQRTPQVKTSLEFNSRKNSFKKYELDCPAKSEIFRLACIPVSAG